MSPKISIIVPAFNEEKHIGRCLDSILSQTFSDFEIICIDDGSTDSTYEIIKEYSEKDSRIIPLKNTKKGVSSARNFGIKNSKGKYLGFVDSDDFIQPQMYEFLYNTIISNDCDVAVCNCEKTSVFNKKEFNYTAVKCSSDYLLKENVEPFVSACTKLIKRELISDNSIFFKNYRIGEDCVFCSEIINKANNIFFIDLPLYIYIINNESATHIDLSNKKWIELSITYFESYDILKNHKVSTWFLENGMKFLLSYKLFSKKNKDKNNKAQIKELYSKYFPEYKKCGDISTANKIYVFISYHFPLLYEVRRKLLDKTIR